MKLHKEGKNIIIVAFFLVAALTFVLLYLGPDLWWYHLSILLAALIFYFYIVRFFRVPNREFIIEKGAIFAPADGEVVVIEKVFEDEYIKKDCIQISVFMSPLNVHINWFSLSGKVKYVKHHPGKYLVAWHPKSSTLNERTSICIENSNQQLIMMRQVAGAVARRIVCYAKPGMEVKQNEELGFIKFGSRVDIYLPENAQTFVNLKEKVVGGRTIIARL
jgi:phosphatidylserine decarboxylase